MLTLLSGIFIKNRKDTSNPEVRLAYGMLCGILGTFLNLLLFAGKLVAGTLSCSIAITADAFNNLSDAGSSLITLIGFKMAGQKPDPDHPFGHGRIEYLSGLFVAIIILLMAFELIKSSFLKILHPDKLFYSHLTAVILVISILVKLYMAFYNRKIGRQIQSAAMKATAADSLNDALSTTVVLAATLTGQLTGLAIDGYCGMLVGLFIFKSGITAVKDTVSPLLGQAPEPEFVRQIQNIVLSHEEVIGIHDLIVHNYGPGRILISLHAEVPADGDIISLHDIIDLIEHELRDELYCSAVIHMDPVRIGDALTNRLRNIVGQMLTELSPMLTMHDFRITQSPTHTKIIFDIVVPYHFEMTDAEIIARLTRQIQHIDSGYFAVIEIDKASC